MSEELFHIEAIKQLKARYCRCLDEKRWEDLRQVFSNDFKGIYEGPHPTVHYESTDEMVTALREILQDAVTVHHCHMPEITLTGDGSAEGIWAMMDFVQREQSTFRGYGHYREKYQQTEQGEWRIRRIHLTRLHIQHLS